MFTMRLIMIVLAVLTLPVFADVADDAIRLAGSGVSEEVLVAWAEKQHATPLNAADILKMREGKVPEKIIVELIHGTAMAQTATRGIPHAAVAQGAEHRAIQYTPPVVQAPAQVEEPVYVAPPTTYVIPESYYDYQYYPYYPYYGGVGLHFGLFGGHYGHYGHWGRR